MDGKLFGYVRVSTNEQNEERQIDLLVKEFGLSTEDIFVDKISGLKAERPALAQLQKALREGDTVIVESLSRVSRTCSDLLQLLADWDARGITFVSLKERLDFSTTTGKLILTILAAIAEFERSIIADRVREGLSAARNRGNVGGRKKTDPKQLEKAIRLYCAKTHTLKEIRELTGVSSPVLYRAMAEME
ncbi:recombinase family protein [Paenibacillaceae bacterium WGS1546]|uniref:recombinase family protein n=1 Tax=Cohnella sp. WGS1546 TaxID=3366810 RepID=UPI00372D8128